MIHVTRNVMKNLYLNEYNSQDGWVSTQKTIESITDHVRMSFLTQSNMHSRRYNFLKKINKKQPIEKANLRRTFPNLKTKPVFPLFLPYLAIKLVYVANIVSHYFLLGFIFDMNYFEFGINTLLNIFYNKFEFLNEYFPKRSLCDIELYVSFIKNHYIAVCSLPINLFNEIFYFGFWYWMLFIGALSIVSIFYWLLMLSKSYRRSFVLNCLQISSNEYKLNSSYTAAFYFNEKVTVDDANAFLVEKTGLNLMENFELFFNDVCSLDLIFAIRLIAINSNQLASRDIFNNLWDQYLDLEELKNKKVKQRPYFLIKRPNLKADEEIQYDQNMDINDKIA